ncbi:MAG: ATP-binding cassette domain-containing protein, partial [Gammaproteobacteria bacterium]
MSTLSAKHLRKQFKSRVVVNNASLEIESGEIVGLLGPNGAGKTTCFYMLVGLIHCNEGTIKLDKQDITRMRMHTRAK